MYLSQNENVFVSEWKCICLKMKKVFVSKWKRICLKMKMYLSKNEYIHIYAFVSKQKCTYLIMKIYLSQNENVFVSKWKCICLYLDRERVWCWLQRLMLSRWSCCYQFIFVLDFKMYLSQNENVFASTSIARGWGAGCGGWCYPSRAAINSPLSACRRLFTSYW